MLLLLIFTIIYGWFGKQRKYYWIWCTLLLIIISNTSVNYADFNNYEKYYNLSNSNIIDSSYLGMPFLWYKMCLFFGGLGFSYRGMNAILILLSNLLINKSINKLKINSNIFWSIFIVFPGLIQIVQLRFFLATSICCLGLVSLLTEDKHSIIKYIFLIFLGYLIHSSCIIFLTFLLIPIFKKFQVKNLTFFSIILSLIFYFILPYVPTVLGYFLPAIKIERYFTSSISTTSLSWFIKIFIIWLFSFVVSNVLYKRIINCLNDDNLKRLLFVKNAKNVIVLLILSLLLLFFDRNFHRFVEISYFILIIYFSIYLGSLKISKKNYLFYFLTTYTIILIITYVYVPFDTVIDPFFTYSGFHSLFI